MLHLPWLFLTATLGQKLLATLGLESAIFSHLRVRNKGGRVIPYQINKFETSCQKTIPIFGVGEGFGVNIKKKYSKNVFEVEYFPKN